MDAYLLLTILGIVLGVIARVNKAKQKASSAAAQPQRPQMARRVTLDDQLRQEIRQRVDAWQPAGVQRSTLESQSSQEGGDARWPIAPMVAPEQPMVRQSYVPVSSTLAVNDNPGGPDDRAVTRHAAQRAYAAEDPHGRERAPHLQDDERGYDSFTGAATFRRSEPRVHGERVDIRPLLQTPIAMANAVILTEVLHHRGGRSAQWSR